jgi:hypothetical protein
MRITAVFVKDLLNYNRSTEIETLQWHRNLNCGPYCSLLSRVVLEFRTFRLYHAARGCGCWNQVPMDPCLDVHSTVRKAEFG